MWKYRVPCEWHQMWLVLVTLTKLQKLPVCMNVYCVFVIQYMCAFTLWKRIESDQSTVWSDVMSISPTRVIMCPVHMTTILLTAAPQWYNCTILILPAHSARIHLSQLQWVGKLIHLQSTLITSVLILLRTFHATTLAYGACGLHFSAT